jgi:ribosome biogenesis GTPase / thiamine phosphate phosphatase
VSRKHRDETKTTATTMTTGNTIGDSTITSPSSTEHGSSLLEGRITEGSRGRYLVETASGAYWCVLRGRLRKDLTYPERTGGGGGGRRKRWRITVREGDPVAIGDRVWLLPTSARDGVIERIAPRDGAALARRDPDRGRAQRPLTSVSGLDQVVIVFAAREPAPHLRLADRFIALAEAQEATVILCINKADQGIEAWLEARLQVYAGLGYSVLRTSAATGEGVAALRVGLAGRVSAFTGPSGVGKSSLLNALEPELALRVAEISEATGKGRHTTTGARLIPLADGDGGWIADTAGIRALALDPATLADLPETFREFRAYRGACAFADCRHLSEPSCAIHAALRAGAIDWERYDSYHRLATGEPAYLHGSKAARAVRADRRSASEDETDSFMP